ncbi:uncharacterized protein GO595_000827 [Histomonas meleagridis]|uniref:uncharacterized protein n=1 Tax=Histomonas meleagridis TaxID=135588 RepID=UPI003559D2E1|nr:hypothetical protein GO595_000827 [Histomonas meleagridis]
MLKDGSSKEFYPPSSRLAPALRAAEAGNLFTVQQYQRFECPVAHRFITQLYSRERQIERFPAIFPKPLYDSVHLNKNDTKEEDKYPPKKKYLEDIHPDTEEILLNDPVSKPVA